MGLINNNVKGDKVNIGRIDLMKNFAFVEVKDKDADRVIKSMKHGVTIKGRSVVVDRSEPKASPGPSQGGEKKRKASHSPSTGREKSRKTSPSPSQRGEKHVKKFEKADWMQFLHPEEGWARRRPKKK